MNVKASKIGIFLLFVLGSVIVSQAQPTVAGVQYFQPGAAYRHHLNPALVPQWGYIGFPVVGNAGLSVWSSMGVADFLYPLENGKMGTWLHPEVSADDFLKNIRKNNWLNASANFSVLSAGWFYGRSFWNFDVQYKINAQINFPYELFEFIKKEMYGNPSEYRIEDLELAAQSYVELGIGYARSLNRDITVGGKFKFLVGVIQAELRVNRMDIHLSDEVWKINSDADFRVFGRLLDMNPDGGWRPPVGPGDIVPSGYGAAIDMGAEYKPSFLPGLRFSAALTDLGFIAYNKSDIQQFSANGEVKFEGFDNIGMDVDLSEEFETLKDDFLQLFNFEENPVAKSTARMVNPTLNLGVEYGFFGNRFSVGLLNTTTFYHSQTESELSLIANIRPARWFSVSLAYSFIGGREALGWALNITPKWGLNLFVASNYTPLKTNPQFIPLKKGHANIQVGLTIPLGNNRAYIYDREPQDVNAFPYSFRYPEEHPNRHYYPEETGYGESPDYSGSEIE